MQLGKRIRDLRFRRGLTVQQLAERSGLSKGFISQVENDRTSPSLATLRDLARALDTSAAYLVIEDDSAPHIVRENGRARIPSGTVAQLQILTAQPRRNLEMMIAEIAPGDSLRAARDYHHGEECVVCLEGRVHVADGEQRIELEAGDSCHYDGRTPHALENHGSGTARVLIAITPASFDPATRPKTPGATSGRPTEVVA